VSDEFVSLDDDQPNLERLFVRPEILLHPNIPKPLHSTCPRNLLGSSWWNKTREEAYAKNNYHCWACGVHKSMARHKQWLEAHEFYDIDYATGTVTFVEAVALCHFCHQYIHSGRIQALVDAGKLSESWQAEIEAHGQKVLKAAGYKKFRPDPPTTKIEEDWTKWGMIVEGKRYAGKFKNMKEWEEFYSGKS
jgi:hypothetical protein